MPEYLNMLAHDAHLQNTVPILEVFIQQLYKKVLVLCYDKSMPFFGQSELVICTGPYGPSGSPLVPLGLSK